MWSQLGNALWSTLFWWVFIIPLAFKIIALPIQLSVLNISTWFRGWKNVANELVDAGIKKGIGKGNYPPNPPEAVWATERFKANAKLVGGAIVNFYVVVILLGWMQGLYG